MKSNHIYPVFNEILNRPDKEKLLNQKSKVIWLTGLSGAGKTTIGVGIERALNKKGYLTQVLDGDSIRTGINNNLGFTEQDRYENIRRIAEVSKLFLDCGIICINSFISPTKNIRQMARDIIGENDFLEIFIDTPLEVCEQRDPKGLYKKARAGEIKHFTGVSAPFEKPDNPFMVVKNTNPDIEETIKQIMIKILPEVRFDPANVN